MGAWLTEAARDRRTRRHCGERDLYKAVEAARQRDASWEEIGAVLNLSPCEAAEREGEPAGRPSVTSARRVKRARRGEG